MGLAGDALVSELGDTRAKLTTDSPSKKLTHSAGLAIVTSAEL